MMVASKTEGYQLLGEVLVQGLKELGYSREDLSVELFASDKQHVVDLYCSKGKNCCYKFHLPSFGMAYGNPRFSELGKVLTNVALECSRMVLCSPNWGALGGNEYWHTLLDRLTVASVQLPDPAIYVPLGCKTPIGKPGWGSMLSVVDGGLTPIFFGGGHGGFPPNLCPHCSSFSFGVAVTGDVPCRSAMALYVYIVIYKYTDGFDPKRKITGQGCGVN